MRKKFKIVLATDYSDAVMNAERYAFQFARKMGASIKMLHVFPMPILNPEASFNASELNYDPFAEQIKNLNEHVKKITTLLNIGKTDVVVETKVRSGNVADEIVSEAKEMEADFIIVGTHGESGFKVLGTGNHAWNVMKKAHLPVLCIPKDALFGTVKNIVFATEYRSGEIPVVNYLAQLAAGFDADLTLLHVAHEGFTKEFEAQIRDNFESEIKNQINYSKLKLKIIHAPDLVEGINNYCTEHKADWLVMSPEKPFFLEKIFNPGGNTKKLSLHTHLPLLTLPDFYNPEYDWFWKLFTIDYTFDED